MSLGFNSGKMSEVDVHKWKMPCYYRNSVWQSPKTPISRNALSHRFIGNFFERLCRLQGKSFCPVTVCWKKGVACKDMLFPVWLIEAKTFCLNQNNYNYDYLFLVQSNTLTVLGRQMFVNYSKSQEIKR